MVWPGPLTIDYIGVLVRIFWALPLFLALIECLYLSGNPASLRVASRPWSPRRCSASHVDRLSRDTGLNKVPPKPSRMNSIQLIPSIVSASPRKMTAGIRRRRERNAIRSVCMHEDTSGSSRSLCRFPRNPAANRAMLNPVLQAIPTAFRHRRRTEDSTRKSTSQSLGRTVLTKIRRFFLLIRHTSRMNSGLWGIGNAVSQADATLSSPYGVYVTCMQEKGWSSPPAGGATADSAEKEKPDQNNGHAQEILDCKARLGTLR